MRRGGNTIKCLLLILLLPTACYAQNAVELLRPIHRGKSAILCREINVPYVLGAPALRVAQLNPKDNCFVSSRGARINISLEREILANSLKEPMRVQGPYKLLKAYSRASKNPILVNEKYIDNWKHINTTGYYNGAHHLISKSTIKLIYLDLKAQGKDVSLNEMESNAPSIYHPLHGDQDYKDVFHDTEAQYYDYKRFGMKVTVASLLERIDELNVALGLGPYPLEYLDGVLKEAELWCKYWGCCWDKGRNICH